MRYFESGATRDSEDGKLDYEGFLSPDVWRRFAEYMHEHRRQIDGKLRDSDNWQKGIPKQAYMKSLFRHFMDTWLIWRGGVPRGKVWEDLLCALLFNVQGLLFESLRDDPMPVKQEVRTSTTGCDPASVVGDSSVVNCPFCLKRLESQKGSGYHTCRGDRVGCDMVWDWRPRN